MFKLNPDDYILTLLTKTLGFKSYKDKKTIIKNNELILNNIKQRFKDIISEINKYYYSEINKDYITTESRCITITRHFLKTKNLDILLIKKMINGEKIKCYKISRKNIRKIKANQNKPKIISFNDW
jgi:hypothetical protein